MRKVLMAAAAVLIALPTAALADRDGHGRGRDKERHHHDHHHDEGRRGHVEDRREGSRGRPIVVREAWRGRPEWRGYSGPRDGYWYAPGYGYRPAARGVEWRRGTYVPRADRVHYVQDPVYYRLAPAPRGHRWVYGDGNFVLMALGTGMITSVVGMSELADPGPPPARRAVYAPPPRDDTIVVARREDVWRGDDGQYHCKRSNGTTGLVIGAAAGALIGHELDGGRDHTTGTIVGAAGGALLGREIERGSLRCR
ncbi:RcnB family protein [Phenylobacterium sp. LjRoot219]|uniref:RcnB family protein n=1 Tax=Phenylobacterium sp. LjRoot219 TaxID=3342283 RepID=UPI003ED145DF